MGSPGHDEPARRVLDGTPAFRRINVALLAAGFATFSLLYAVQPLLPVFAIDFHITAAASSLALSSTTCVLAVGLLFASSLSEAVGRRPVMLAALFSASLLTLASAAAPGWPAFLLVRTVEGFAFSGLPAIAMAYVAEEVDPRSAGRAMGLYIAGSAFGGMAGRVIAGLISDAASWRAAIAGVGLIGLVCAMVFSRLLPPSRNFTPRRLRLHSMVGNFGRHLGDPILRRLYLLGFTLMGGFVTAYNYFGFRLLAAPFRLSQAAVGLISALYLAGIVSSAAVGRLGDRFGSARLLLGATALMLAGALLTLPASLPGILLGLALLTAAFFAAHTLASAAVARRAMVAPAQASSLYLFAYYMGSSLAGSAGGIAYHRLGWTGVVALIAGLLLVASGVAWQLARQPPSPQPGRAPTSGDDVHADPVAAPRSRLAAADRGEQG
jgi:YNFM family putative membrane transporter